MAHSETKKSLRPHASAGYGASGSRNSNTEDTLAGVVTQIRSFFAIIRSRWLSGVVSALVVGSAFAYLFLNDKPEHTAVSTMLAQSPLDELLHSDQQARERKKDAQENFLQNHLSVMKSRRFSVELASEFTEDEKASIVRAFVKGDGVPSMSAFEKILAGRMDATRQRDREFFTLSFRHPEAEIALMVADRMTAAYLKLVQREIKETNQAAAEMLRLQAEQLQAEISELEGKQRDFRERNNVISLEENQDLLAERLKGIDANRIEARLDRFRLETKLGNVKAALGEDGRPFDNPFLANFANNERLRQELDKLNGQREVMALRYGRNHPKMRDLDSRIEAVEGNLNRNMEMALKDLEGQYTNVVSLEKRLDDDFRKKFTESIEVGRLADQFLVIGSEVDAKREALTSLLRRVSNANVVSNLPVDVMRVVDPAFIAKPKLAKRKLVAAFTVLLAGGAFFGVPLGMQLFDQRLKCATDIEKEFGKGLLGGIPKLSRVKVADRPHVVRDNLDLAKVESFMAVVAQLELTSKQEGPKSFVVTSTTTSEGKSTIAANVASGFVQIKRKTIIIDGDLRRPCLHQFNRIKKSGGLIRWAEEGYPMDDIYGEDSPLGIQKLKGGAYLLPAGGVFPLPSKLLVSTKIDALLRKLEETFEVIIVDTPPVGLYPDALIFAKSVGETLLVARESKAPISQIRQVIGDIDSTGAPVLGLVLNDYSFGSLNPRLAYGGKGKYKYHNNIKKHAKGAGRVKSKSMVGKLMAEDVEDDDNLEAVEANGKVAETAKSKLKSTPLKLNNKNSGSKSLIGKLMSEQEKKE
ncbi:capsular exopolysaccharide family protein [Verrucomicrobiia bacterium DG1235]|nr:capsular exopolysaccharide family protein [Verrucomicrobiae bacterium DG1235]